MSFTAGAADLIGFGRIYGGDSKVCGCDVALERTSPLSMSTTAATIVKSGRPPTVPCNKRQDAFQDSLGNQCASDCGILVVDLRVSKSSQTQPFSP